MALEQGKVGAGRRFYRTQPLLGQKGVLGRGHPIIKNKVSFRICLDRLGIDGFIWLWNLQTSNGNWSSRYYPQHRRLRGQGRPPAHSPRSILEGILCKLRSGARWELCRNVFLSYQTCHRWLQRWRKQAHLKKILFALANANGLEQGKLGLDEGL